MPALKKCLPPPRFHPPPYHKKGLAVPKRTFPCPPPPPANHHQIGEEVEWRPPLLYANRLGHRVPSTFDI